MATTDKTALEGKVAAELHQIAADLGIEGHKGLKKADLVDKILAHNNGGGSAPNAGGPPATATATATEDAQPSPNERSSTQAYTDMDPSYEELWEGTDSIKLDLPDIPALDLDWGEEEDPA